MYFNLHILHCVFIFSCILLFFLYLALFLRSVRVVMHTTHVMSAENLAMRLERGSDIHKVTQLNQGWNGIPDFFQHHTLVFPCASSRLQ